MNTSTVSTFSIPIKWRKPFRVLWFVLASNALWSYAWTIISSWQFIHEAPPRIQAGFDTSWLTPEIYFWANTAIISILFFTFFTFSLLLYLRLPHDRMALFTSIFLMNFGLANALPYAPEFLAFVTETSRLYYLIPFVFANLASWPLMVLFFGVYPDGRFVPGWVKWIAIFGFGLSVWWGISPLTFAAPTGWFAIFLGLSLATVFGGSIYAQICRYRQYASPIQRQQIKWFVFSLIVVALVTLVQEVLSPLGGSSDAMPPAQSVLEDLVGFAWSITFIAIPIAIGIAIMRYRLWDVDNLIRRTLQYALLTGLLALVYFGGVVLLQGILRPLTGESESPIVTVISTLGIAALFNPLRIRIQNFIDRRFYRKKYNAELALAEFAQVTRDEVEMDRLTTALLGVAEEAMQPEQISLWLKPSKGRGQ